MTNPQDQPVVKTEDARLPLSVCIITLNEEAHIERCLKSVAFAGEVVVIDSGSIDRTAQIVRACGARLIHHDWAGYAQQKQFAVQQAQYDWVFSIDADEYPDAQLTQNIIALFQQPMDPAVSYRVNRMSWYINRWIRHGGWYPDPLVRLFHRQHARWDSSLVHEKVLTNGPIQALEGHLLHCPYLELHEQVLKLNRYTDLQAQELNAKGASVTLLGALSRSLFRILRSYLFRFGFMDGKAGLINAVMDGWSCYLKYVKLWALQHGVTDPPSASIRNK